MRRGRKPVLDSRRAVQFHTTNRFKQRTRNAEFLRSNAVIGLSARWHRSRGGSGSRDSDPLGWILTRSGSSPCGYHPRGGGSSRRALV